MSERRATLDNGPDGPAMLTSVAWVSALLASSLLAQQVQLSLLSGWQLALADMDKAMWEGWRCRFAGGVPLAA